MTDQPTRAVVLIGCNWHRCKVLAVNSIPHWSGTVSKRFTVQFDDGQTIFCGSNSIRFPKKKTNQ